MRPSAINVFTKEVVSLSPGLIAGSGLKRGFASPRREAFRPAGPSPPHRERGARRPPRRGAGHDRGARTMTDTHSHPSPEMLAKFRAREPGAVLLFPSKAAHLPPSTGTPRGSTASWARRRARCFTPARATNAGSRSRRSGSIRSSPRSPTPGGGPSCASRSRPPGRARAPGAPARDSSGTRRAGAGRARGASAPGVRTRPGPTSRTDRSAETSTPFGGARDERSHEPRSTDVIVGVL
jgi:hypothetical protein